VALSQTGLAIGQVSRFISGILTSGLSRVHPAPVITVQRPQVETTGTQTSPRINLFLYEVEIDAAPIVYYIREVISWGVLTGHPQLNPIDTDQAPTEIQQCCVLEH